MRRYALFFLMFLPGAYFSQIFNPYLEVFGEYPFFNQRFIAQNNIFQLSCKVLYKKSGDIIRSKGESESYFFDRNGRLTHFYKLISWENGLDTLHYFYGYNPDTLIAIYYTYDKGFNKKTFVYDKDKKCIAIQYSRIANQTADLLEVNFGNETFLTEEKLEYVYQDGKVVKRVYINNFGLPFKEEIVEYDDHGYVVRHEFTYVTSGQREVIYYEYDNYGWIKSKTCYYPSENKTEKKLYYHDALGNLLKIEYFENDNMTHVEEFLYDKNTYIIRATIKKRLTDEFITIRKFD